jgi:penicillin-binding protein-related factor A (putative recombinase)
MAQTPEGKVKDKIKKILKAHNIYFAMPMGTGYGHAGVPDFLCCFKGKFLAIEAKAGRGQPTELQLQQLREIESAHGETWIVNEQNLELFELWVKTNL